MTSNLQGVQPVTISEPQQLYQPWHHYKRPFVRDLAFALACPDALTHWVLPHVAATELASKISLTNDLNLADKAAPPNILVHDNDFWRRQYHHYRPRLQVLDSSPHYQQLTKYLMQRPSPYRLGFHFEGLIHFWLEDGYRLGLHPYEVLAHNVQLYQGKQTTGELDFILRDTETDAVEHWEVAIKFYLGSPPYQLKNWVGMNRKDNFARKMQHMQDQQFRATKVDLDGYHEVDIDKRYVVIKGRFFECASQPYGVTTKATTDAGLVSPSPSSPLPSSPQSPKPRPVWLNADFPLHQWYSVNNELDLQPFNQSAQTASLMGTLRPAHYIERFTYRPFYDAGFLAQGLGAQATKQGNALKKQLLTPLSFAQLETNLYMNDGEPVILVVNKGAKPS